MSHIKKIEKLAKKGFLCEIVTDGWANWKFGKDGRPMCDTATPSGRGFGWRGCFWYFDKKGKLHQDDTGLYYMGHGGIKECFKSLFEAYEEIKTEIDPKGFVLKPNREQTLSSVVKKQIKAKKV